MYIMMCNLSIVNSIILQLHPQGIWLRCEFSHRVIWPTDEGDFILGSASDYAHLIVEGPSATIPPVSEAAASGASASLTTLSGMGSSGRSSPRQWSGFKSVIHPSTPPSAKKIKGTHTLKIIVARMRYINAKPEFERVDQIFIPIVEATATLPHILSEVKQHAGEDFLCAISHDVAAIHETTDAIMHESNERC